MQWLFKDAPVYHKVVESGKTVGFFDTYVGSNFEDDRPQAFHFVTYLKVYSCAGAGCFVACGGVLVFKFPDQVAQFVPGELYGGLSAALCPGLYKVVGFVI